MLEIYVDICMYLHKRGAASESTTLSAHQVRAEALTELVGARSLQRLLKAAGKMDPTSITSIQNDPKQC